MKKEENIYEYVIPYNEIKLYAEQIVLEIGYRSEKEALNILPEIEKVVFELEKNVCIKGGFIIIDGNEIRVEDDFIHIGEEHFNCGKVINTPLRGMSSVSIFVVTIGKEFDEWCGRIFRANEMAGYIADIAGSMLVEKGADWIENKINEHNGEKGFKCSNRFSPGYCGWDVAEQKNLFSFLPKEFCGIKLTESCLMIPKKSVSGIIGAGADIKKSDYRCNICKLENCFRRRE